MYIPQSIQIVTRKVIDDQQIIDLTSALRNVSGVLPGTDAGNRSESFTIRGFRSSYYALDSIMLSPAVQTNDSYRDLANVERIEVLKGPASVLYGRGDPGGLINIVTKQPKYNAQNNITVQGGSFGFIRGQGDITGAINKEHTLAFRLIGAIQKTDTFRDILIPYQRQFVAGSLLWQPSDRTTALASLTYTHQSNQTDRGIVATPSIDGKSLVVNLPRERFLGEKWAQTDSNRIEFNYRLEHQTFDWLKLRQIGHYDAGYIDILGVNYGNGVRLVPRTNTRTLRRSSVRQNENNHNLDFQLDAIATATTFGFKHTIVVGGEWLKGYRFRTFDRGSLANIDIDHPVYGAQPTNWLAAADRTVRAKSISTYLQDQIDIGRHLNLLGGLRFDHVRQSDFGVTGFSANDKKISPRAGIVWRPVSNLAFFFDYTRSFQSQPAPTLSGMPIPPETGQQFEAGVKAQMFHNRLFANLALYHLVRSHVAQQDPKNYGFNIDAGKQRSRGIEVDLNGSLSREVRMIVTGAYTDTSILESSVAKAGNGLIGVPKWAGSAWITYEPRTGFLHNAGIGGGVFAASNREGDLENSFRVGGYRRLDATIWRDIGKYMRISLNIKNITNSYYIESTVSSTQITPGAGRTFLAGASATF
ncbi:TonB-dependent siderophore receptor [Asaia sp. BMEF1]|uniref:TonB-dependent siderophore receptor n=1 Tax=Asaia sp. BMEF1 TaxID=3155932 RepID=UPI003F673E52